MNLFSYGPPDLFGHRDVLACGDGVVQVYRMDKDAADEIITRGHYSHSVVWSSSMHFGVRDVSNGLLIGALQFGPAMNPASGGKVVRDCLPDEWLELNRMWLSDAKPINCATRAISYALRLAKADRPGLTWVQSFADSRCRKAGGVYQAASFLYLGSHRSTFYELDGEWFHKSMKGRKPIDKRGWGSGPKVARFAANADRAVAHTFTQYRYIRFLEPRAKARLLLPVLPYPKPDQQPGQVRREREGRSM